MLLYGHYDVQPVIDEAHWSSPPFAPVVRGDAVYGRGASDMKGPLVSLLVALESMLLEGPLPINVKVLLEGEEEIFSPRLRAILQRHREQLRCDMAVSSDGTQPLEGTPRVMLGTRGLCDLELIVRGARTDLHSGQYGGAVPNPAQILAEIVASMHDARGAIRVEGFADEILPVSAAERERLAAVRLGRGDRGPALGLREFVGDPSVVGLGAHHPEAHAGAERDPCRLRGRSSHDGDPGDGARRHLVPSRSRRNVPSTCSRRSNATSGWSRRQPWTSSCARPRRNAGLRTTRAHPASRAVADVLGTLYGHEPLDNVDGGTIAALALLQEELGVETATLGFAGDDENAHGADESTGSHPSNRGRAAYRLLLDRLAGRDT